MGNNVVLTLDRTLQYITEKELGPGGCINLTPPAAPPW